MIDREKVLEGMKELCEYLYHEYKVCYHGDEEDIYNRFPIANNALNLLEEQEAVEPKIVSSAKGFFYTCGTCGQGLVEVRDTVSFDDRKRIRFCTWCGKKVKWE